MPVPAPPAMAALQTPCLVVDEARMQRNIDRAQARLAGTGAALRPHLKTAKSLDVSLRLCGGAPGPAMVSTLKEAEVFAAGGFRDLTYGVGIAPDKLERVRALRRSGVDLAVILDSVAQAEALAAASDPGDPIPALIEIDCDGHRSGVAPGDAGLLVAIAAALAGGAALRGALTHGGESYEAGDAAALVAAAVAEREGVTRAAAILREAGYETPVVSAGSTPTLMAAPSFEGLTEFRAGVFVFFDLFQAGVGACAIDDIALGVLTEVIGHQEAKGWTIVDAGWMAMSRDRGTARQRVDQGYGIVCDARGRPIPDLIMVGANQEHGIVAPRPGSGARAPDLPLGTRLRILPNHACATGAQHDRYHVLGRGQDDVTAEWPRFSGW